jgi:hypothetical protein
MDRTSASGAEGHRFKSCLAHLIYFRVIKKYKLLK